VSSPEEPKTLGGRGFAPDPTRGVYSSSADVPLAGG